MNLKGGTDSGNVHWLAKLSEFEKKRKTPQQISRMSEKERMRYKETRLAAMSLMFACVEANIITNHSYTFSARLEFLFAQSSLSQKDISIKSGVNASVISDYLNGKRGNGKLPAKHLTSATVKNVTDIAVASEVLIDVPWILEGLPRAADRSPDAIIRRTSLLGQAFPVLADFIGGYSRAFRGERTDRDRAARLLSEKVNKSISPQWILSGIPVRPNLVQGYYNMVYQDSGMAVGDPSMECSVTLPAKETVTLMREIHHLDRIIPEDEIRRIHDALEMALSARGFVGLCSARRGGGEKQSAAEAKKMAGIEALRNYILRPQPMSQRKRKRQR